jgi:hypothetical protein
MPDVSEDALSLNLTLPTGYGDKLSRIAARTQVAEGTLASALLAQAIDDADPEPSEIVALLDRIPGAWDRIETGAADAREGSVVPLEEL